MTNSNENQEVKSEPAGYRCRGRWKIPFFIAAIVLLKSGLVFLLWNALIPSLFHGPALNYLQALGITVLARLLVGFGGFRPFAGRFGGPGWRGRWAAFSPEEREKLREELRHRCGG